MSDQGFSVKIEDKELLRVMKHASANLVKEIEVAVNKTALFGNRKAVEVTPKITGNLRRGYHIEKQGNLGRIIKNPVEYLEPVEFGWARFSGHHMLELQATPAINDRLVAEIKVAIERTKL